MWMESSTTCMDSWTLCTISCENLQFRWFLDNKLVSWQLASFISKMVEMVMVHEQEAPQSSYPFDGSRNSSTLTGVSSYCVLGLV
jgi:hypothetical protein